MSLEAESANVRFNLDRMASYSASLFDVGYPSRIACSSCSSAGDFRRRPTPDPNDQEASSTCKIYHPDLPNSMLWVGCRGISTMKSTMTCPFMDNLSWYSISYSLNSMAHWSILPYMFGLCKILDWSQNMCSNGTYSIWFVHQRTFKSPKLT